MSSRGGPGQDIHSAFLEGGTVGGPDDQEAANLLNLEAEAEAEEEAEEPERDAARGAKAEEGERNGGGTGGPAVE